jgi:hypothetical protein
MRASRWLMTAMLGLLLAGCAAISTDPTPETRQALAPTGKLRVALQLANPLNGYAAWLSLPDQAAAGVLASRDSTPSPLLGMLLEMRPAAPQP